MSTISLLLAVFLVISKAQKSIDSFFLSSNAITARIYIFIKYSYGLLPSLGSQLVFRS